MSKMASVKAEIRREALARRAALSADARREASKAVAHAVLGMWDLYETKIVLGYWATPEEIDPFPIVDALRFRGLVTALPRVEDEPTRLSLHAWDEGTTLVQGPYGIMEPDRMAPVVQALDVDAILVPGVAFDPAGNRIGYGGGYYDRLLPLIRGNAALIGLAFDEQIFDEVPSDDHDRPVNVVVTPTNVYRRPSAQPKDE